MADLPTPPQETYFKMGGCIAAFSYLFDRNHLLHSTKCLSATELLQHDREKSPHFKNSEACQIRRSEAPISGECKQFRSEIQTENPQKVPIQIKQLHQLLHVQEDRKEPPIKKLSDRGKVPSTKGNLKNDRLHGRKSLCLKKIKLNEVKRTCFHFVAKSCQIRHAEAKQQVNTTTSTQSVQLSSKLHRSPRSLKRISSPVRSPIQSPSKKPTFLVEAATTILEPNGRPHKSLLTVRSLLLEFNEEPAMVERDETKKLKGDPDTSNSPEKPATSVLHKILEEKWDTEGYSEKHWTNVANPVNFMLNKPTHCHQCHCDAKVQIPEHMHDIDCSLHNKVHPDDKVVNKSASKTDMVDKSETLRLEMSGLFSKLFGSNKDQRVSESHTARGTLRYLLWTKESSDTSTSGFLSGGMDGRQRKFGIISKVACVASLLFKRKKLQKQTAQEDVKRSESSSTEAGNKHMLYSASESMEHGRLANNKENSVPCVMGSWEHLVKESLSETYNSDDRQESFCAEKSNCKKGLVDETDEVEIMQLDYFQGEVNEVLEVLRHQSPRISLDTLRGVTKSQCSDDEQNLSSVIVEKKSETIIESQQELPIIARARANLPLLCDFSWWTKDDRSEANQNAESEHEIYQNNNKLAGYPNEFANEQWMGSPPYTCKLFNTNEESSIAEAKPVLSVDHICLDKEHFSPISVLEVSFEEDSRSLENSIANFEEAKKRLLEKVQKFELLAGVDLSLLENCAMQEDLSSSSRSSSSRSIDLDRNPKDGANAVGFFEEDHEVQSCLDLKGFVSLGEWSSDYLSLGSEFCCDLAPQLSSREDAQQQKIQSSKGFAPNYEFLERFKRRKRQGSKALFEPMSDALETMTKLSCGASYFVEAYVLSRRRVMKPLQVLISSWPSEALDNALERDMLSGRNKWKDFSKEAEELGVDIECNISCLLLHELLADLTAEVYLVVPQSSNPSH